MQSNQHMIAVLFPIDFGKKAPNYLARCFREQVSQTANSDPHGLIPIWIWPQGPFTYDLWQEIVFAAGDTAEDYLQVLRDYSLAFARSQS